MLAFLQLDAACIRHVYAMSA